MAIRLQIMRTKDGTIADQVSAEPFLPAAGDRVLNEQLRVVERRFFYKDGLLEIVQLWCDEGTARKRR